jgi:general stress protein 26
MSNQEKTPQDPVTTPEERQALFEKIEKVRFAMVTTAMADGSLASRPMTLQGVDGDGTMWFFTSASTQLGDDVNRDERVNVAFADTGDDFYLSATGSAWFVDDLEKIEALWGVMAAAWFDGPTDPNLWLLRVKPDRIDYWKSGAGKVLQMVAMAKAALTNTRPGKAVGEHGSFEPGKAA